MVVGTFHELEAIGSARTLITGVAASNAGASSGSGSSLPGRSPKRRRTLPMRYCS